jgi:hypothetical protein
VIAVDNEGNLFDGDQIIALLAKNITKKVAVTKSLRPS